MPHDPMAASLNVAEWLHSACNSIQQVMTESFGLEEVRVTIIVLSPSFENNAAVMTPSNIEDLIARLREVQARGPQFALGKKHS